MATAKELGLVDGTNEMMLELNRISKGYSDGNRWQGFTKFMLYKPQSNNELMSIRQSNIPFRPYENTLGISVNIIPDLVKLYQISPDLFNELILAILAHEGGKVGHLMRWPITSVEEAIKYFDWNKLTAQSASILIQNFVRRIWPIEIENRGTPPFDQWLSAGTILKQSLKRFAYNWNNPEPFGVIWKEFQAMFGMVQDLGISSAAIFFWFMRDFRKIDINLHNEFTRQFYFFNAQEQKEVILLMANIQREYKQHANQRSGFIAGMFHK